MSNVLGTIDGSTSNQASISAYDMFLTKRVDGEPDLVSLMIRDLTNHYDAVAANVFANNASIIGVKSLNPISQRITINRWFTNTLFVYRSRSENRDVSEILLHIINDGSIQDWFELMQRVVIPFFKNNNVIYNPIGE